MGRSNSFKAIMNSLKDKASIIKASLTIKRRPSSIRVAVLRATTHDSTAPPSETRLAALLALGRDSRSTACACIEALMDRLHRTRSAIVALKCLFALHNVVARGSFILRDQLSIFPFSGGRNFLNLSTFRDESSSDMREFSVWVRWYAGIVEQILRVSRELGYHFCSTEIKDKESTVSGISNSDLSLEIDILVEFVELISEAPESLNLQRNNLVYEVVKMAAENYRLVQREIFVRVKEVADRLEGLNETELTEWLRSFERFESCRERLFLLFANKVMNQSLWDLIRLTKMQMEKTKEGRAAKSLVLVGKRYDWKESTRFWNPFLDPGESIRIQTSDGLLLCWA